MAGGRDDDMEWLYGRGGSRPEDGEKTRPMSSGAQPDPAPPRPRTRASFGSSQDDPHPPQRSDSNTTRADAAGPTRRRTTARPAPPPRPGKPYADSAEPTRRPYGAPASRQGPGDEWTPGDRAGVGWAPGQRPDDEWPPGQRPGGPYASRPRDEYAARPAQHRRRGPVGRRRPSLSGRKVGLGVLALLVAWLVFLIATPLYAWSQTTKVDTAYAGSRPPEQPGTTYLLVGSDSRQGLSEEDRKRLGTGDTEGQRTDTIMLLYVPTSGKPALISIPRDSYVPIPGHGKNKINAAYAFGGPKLLVQTVEQNTGLRIDNYVEVGFGGFVSVIDALGGITMCPDKAIKDHNAHLNIPAGCQNMNGVTALGYVRMRYADPTGDLGRMNRQRQMIAAIVKKAATPWTVLNPFRWWALNTGAAKSLRVGNDTGIGALAGLVSPMQKLSSGQGLTLMVPVSNPNATTAAGSSMLWDNAKAKEMFTEIARGDTSKLQRFAKP